MPVTSLLVVALAAARAAARLENQAGRWQHEGCHRVEYRVHRGVEASLPQRISTRSAVEVSACA